MALSDLAPQSVNNAAQNKASSNLNPVNWAVNARANLDTLVNRFVIKPALAHGIHGFVFDYEGDTQVTLQSEITEHYTEENQFFQDHAAHKPMRIMLRGFVGEVVYKPQNGVLGALANLQNRLTTLPAILGKYTPGTVTRIQRGITQATNVVNKVDNLVNRAQNLIGLFVSAAPGQTKQQRAFAQLQSDWASSIVFGVETPYGFFQSMVIEQVSLVQDEITKSWSDIAVTLKEVRFIAAADTASGQSAAQATKTNSGRAAQQAQGQTNKGKTKGTPSVFSNLFSSFGHVTASL